MKKIRDVTDPQELLLAQLEEVRRGNNATRDEIRRLRAVLKGGQDVAQQLRDELLRLKAATGNDGQ